MTSAKGESRAPSQVLLLLTEPRWKFASDGFSSQERQIEEGGRVLT
jgi:hypothetical protein